MPPTPASTPERFVLPNGLTVLVESLRHSPVVALQAWVRAGGADETEEVLGVAHLHEHMLFKGTQRRGVGEIARSVESAGGEVNAWTSFDETVYHLTMERTEAALGVDILADALRASAFDADELRRESEVVLEEIRRAQDSPARRLHQAVFARVFDQHPYRRPVLGYEQTVRSMTREQILTFYRRYYRPDNVTFVAVGDVSSDEVLAEVRARFGDWQPAAAAPLPRPARPQQPVAAAPQLYVLAEDVQESRLAMAWLGPALSSPAVAAFDLMSMVLGHGETSRLFDALQRRQDRVHDVHAYAYTPRDHGLLWVGAGLKSADAATVVQAIADELTGLCRAPVSAAELDRARTTILSEAGFQRESMQGQARKRGFFEVTGGDWRMEEAYLEAVRALTPADLQAVAKAVLASPPTLVVQVPQADAGAVADQAILLATLAQLQESARGAAAVAASPPTAAAPPVAADVVAATPARRAPGVVTQAVVRHQLDCGAILLVAPEHGPVVALRAVALGGQRWELDGQTGISNLFARLYGQATGRRDSRGMAEATAALGGGIGAFAGRNSVGLRGDFLAERAGAGCELFAEALTQPAWHAADLTRERGQILEAIRVRQDSPQALAMDLFAESVYGGHPFGRALMGTPETVACLGLAQFDAYFQRFLAPSRLVLSLVGDVDAAWAADFFNAHLSGGLSKSLPPPAWTPRPQVRRRHLPLDKKQSQVMMGGLGVSLSQPDRFAAEVATTLLSGQGGRLFTDLRDRQSLAYSVHSASVPGLDSGHIMAFIGTHPAKVPQAIAGVRRHLEQLGREPATEEELQRARRYLVGSHGIGLQTSGARATTMALNEAYGLGHDAHLAYPAAIGKVDAAAAQTLVGRLLSDDKLVEVVVGPGAT